MSEYTRRSLVSFGLSCNLGENTSRSTTSSRTRSRFHPLACNALVEQLDKAYGQCPLLAEHGRSTAAYTHQCTVGSMPNCGLWSRGVHESLAQMPVSPAIILRRQRWGQSKISCGRDPRWRARKTRPTAVWMSHLVLSTCARMVIQYAGARDEPCQKLQEERSGPYEAVVNQVVLVRLVT